MSCIPQSKHKKVAVLCPFDVEWGCVVGGGNQKEKEKKKKKPAKKRKRMIGGLKCGGG